MIVLTLSHKRKKGRWLAQITPKTHKTDRARNSLAGFYYLAKLNQNSILSVKHWNEQDESVMKLPAIPAKYASLFLRIVMGLIFVTHGAARLFYNSVSDFGTYLNSQGFIIGVFLAWTITIGEIVFGSMLAMGYKVKYCVIFHALVVVSGIFLIHLPNGWFVVGHGTNGAEYSVLILAVLVFLYSRE